MELKVRRSGDSGGIRTLGASPDSISRRGW